MRFSNRTWMERYLHHFRRAELRTRNVHPLLPSPENGKARGEHDDQTFSHYVRAFLEDTTDCVFFLDRGWRLTFLNKRAAEELPGGVSLIGMPLAEALPDSPNSVFEHYYRRAKAENSTQVFEAYYAPLATWYEVHAVPVDDGLMVIFRNINERRAAAEALRERERQLATVFGQTMVGILHRDLDLNVLMVNQRFCEIVGRSREELNGLPVQELTYAEDIEASLTLSQRHAETGDPFQMEKRYVRPDGSLVWCAVNVSFVRDDTGKIVSTIMVAEDITARKAAEEKVREGQALLQVVIDSVQDMIFVKDRQGRYVLTNQRIIEEYGSLDGRTDRELFPPHLAESYLSVDRHVLASGEISTGEEIVIVGGEARTFHTVKVPWRRDGEIIGVIGVSRDMTGRLEAEAELRESRRQLATLIDNLPGLVYRCSLTPPWPFSFMSEGAESLTGYPASAFMEGRITWAEIVHPDDLEQLSKSVADGVEERRPFSRTYRIVTHSGEVRWVLERGQCIYDASGAPNFLEGFINDVTTQKNAEERLRWGAHHDSLTHLPNRMLFHERLDEALKRSALAGRKVGLLLLDVDHLKEVNDTLGHDAGDVLLCMVATRLSTSVRRLDTVARNGGDEFAVILPDIGGKEDLQALIHPILKNLQEPFTYAGHMMDCRASIGASLWPDHAAEADGLLKQADIALYTAKATGRGKVMIFEPAMRAEARSKAQMRQNAREAIDGHRIEPHYQPKVHLASGKLAGFEALLRWRNPQAGIELPSTIQAAFDDPRLAIEIGQQMHDLVIEDMRRWLDAGIEFGRVAINASAAEFRGAGFAEQVLERLRIAGVPTHCLELEVTETVFLGRGAEHVENALRILSAAGVKIALDDFGTGYASLSHLKQFPVDIIKIDRSFVRDLADNPDDTAILLAVLNLGQNLGIDTVAEGVETEVQADFLRAQGCNIGQGFLFGRAAPKGQIPDLIASWNSARFAPAERKMSDS